MKIKLNSKQIREILIGITIVLLALSANIILSKNLPIKSSNSSVDYSLSTKNDKELLKELQADPKKMITVNIFILSFVAFFLLGIVNFALLSKSIGNRSKMLKDKREKNFPKALPFSKALLCLSSVYLWYTISKESQLLISLLNEKPSFTFILIMTFFIQILSIISIINLSSIKFFRFSKKLLAQIPTIVYFYLALIPSSIALASISGIVASKYGFPLEPMPLIGIMASGKLSCFAYTLLGIEAVIFAPIFEELLFRGVIFASLRKKFSFGFSALVSGMIFSILHEHYLSFLPILLLAVAFSYLYERTRNLFYPIALHAIYNGVSLLSITLLKDIIN